MLKLDRHVPSPGVPELNRRFGWVVAVVALGFLLLIARLWHLQLVRGQHYFDLTTNNFEAEAPIPAVRGKIKDRRGVVLASNRPSFNVYVTPRYFTPEAEAALSRLLGLASHELDELREQIGVARKKKDLRTPLLFLSDIDRDKLAILTQAHAELPGVTVNDVPRRHYPHVGLAAHVLGYMNKISKSEFEARAEDGYTETDLLGRTGVESQWENYLRGKPGLERYVVDAKGQRKSDREAEELIKGERFIAPIPGHNVILTIDVELQRIADSALGDNPAGGIAVVDVKTGRILALVSRPAYDPNVMSGRLTRAEEAQLNANPYKPFIDKTLNAQYYPGSTYKFVTALAALEAKVVTPEEKILCPGWLDVDKRHCTKAHGRVGFYEAMAQSCNVYYWTLAQRLEMDRISRVAEEFGFGSPTGLGLNGDLRGRIPWKQWYDEHQGFRPGYTLNTAIGQGDTEVTVLQLALAYATLGNGGDLWIPQIVERVETSSGKLVVPYPPTLRRHINVSPESMRLIQKSLYGTVNEPKGTAYNSRLPDIHVSGKTGTAQVRGLPKAGEVLEYFENHHAWFAGYAPSEDPQIAVVVLVEHGGKGGGVAAPVAMKVIRGYFDLQAERLAEHAGSDADSSTEGAKP
jgi:penicillin-binding protein 2